MNLWAPRNQPLQACKAVGKADSGPPGLLRVQTPAAAAAMEGLPEAFPASRAFDMVGHAKAVVALEADSAGSRLIAGEHALTDCNRNVSHRRLEPPPLLTRSLPPKPIAGGVDGKLGIWDFGGLTQVRLIFVSYVCALRCASLHLPGQARHCSPTADAACILQEGKPFRSLEPAEGYPVVAVSWSPSGDAFLVCTGNSQASKGRGRGRAAGWHGTWPGHAMWHVCASPRLCRFLLRCANHSQPPARPRTRPAFIQNNSRHSIPRCLLTVE